MWLPTTPLADLLASAAAGNLEPGWLYLPTDWRTWNENTPAVMLDHGDIDDAEFEQIEADAQQRGFRSTIDSDRIEDIVQGVHDVLRTDAPSARVEALIYYIRFDAFLPHLGAPAPPPPEESQRRLDREFYDSLGSERPPVPCRAPGCTRGAVRMSVFCKPHHFQQVRKRDCPFND